MRQLFAFATLLLLFQTAVPTHVLANEGKGAEHMQELKEKRFDHMTKELKLTADQQKTVKAALDEKSDKMQALFEEQKGKMKAIQDEANTKINAVLNDDQKAKFATMLEQHKENRSKKLKDHK